MSMLMPDCDELDVACVFLDLARALTRSLQLAPTAVPAPVAAPLAAADACACTPPCTWPCTYTDMCARTAMECAQYMHIMSHVRQVQVYHDVARITRNGQR